MFGIVALILLGIAAYIGYSGADWAWCFALGGLGVPVYYGTKGEQGAALFASQFQIIAMHPSRVITWIIGVYGGQVAIMAVVFGLGRLIAAVF